MRSEELYHGTKGDNILSILSSGVIRPRDGEIYFGKWESQFHTLFPYGGDLSRGAAFVIKVKVQIPDSLRLRPGGSRAGAPTDTWVLDTSQPIAAQVLKLYVRSKPGQPLKIVDGPQAVRHFLEVSRKSFDVLIDRKYSFTESIVGDLSVNGAFVCYTLELAWLWNEKYKSCVPPGKYSAFLRHDHEDKWRIELTGVPGNRTHVEIHIGNYPKDSVGCVLVGTSYSAGNVWDSGKAYEKLRVAYQRAPGAITVEFKGLLATPWGDYPRHGSTRNLA